MCHHSVGAAGTIRVILPLLTGSGPANALSPPTHIHTCTHVKTHNCRIKLHNLLTLQHSQVTHKRPYLAWETCQQLCQQDEETKKTAVTDLARMYPGLWFPGKRNKDANNAYAKQRLNSAYSSRCGKISSADALDLRCQYLFSTP